MFTGVDSDGGKKKIVIRKNTLNLVQDYRFGIDATSPSFVTDPNSNRILVAWEDNDGGTETGKNIYGQLVDASNFITYGNQINIAKAVGDQTSPVSAYDNVNQRFLVAWEDARNQSANISNIDIYSQFVDPQGNLSGGNAIVTVANGNQLAPAVSFGDVNFRDFLVAWSDGREPSDADIYGQLLQFSTSPQLVITDANDNPILNGSINFGNVTTGLTSDINFKIRNDGNNQLTIDSMSSPDAPFSFTTPAPQTISPGNSYLMTVRFAPVGAGSFAGNSSNNFKTAINSDGGQALLYFSGNAVGVNPLAVTTSSLPDVNQSTAYSATFAASGGVFPYTWSTSNWKKDGVALGGATSLNPLGAGALTLNPTNGALTGTSPALSGVYTFTVTATDNDSPANTATRDMTINVLNPSALQVTTTSLKTWTQLISYGTQTLTNSVGAGGPYTWSISAGSGAGTLIPVPGLLLNASTGVISGTPTGTGIFNFTVKVTDSASATATKALSITINPSPVVLTSSLAQASKCALYPDAYQVRRHGSFHMVNYRGHSPGGPEP
jgi:hypothetical protein